MLQAHKDQSVVQPDLGSLSPDETLTLLFSFIRRQFRIILFIVTLVVTLGLIYVVTSPPGFTAVAKLMIDSRKVQLFQQQSILGDIPIDSASVESQVEVLKSENVALSVIKNLNLLQDREFVGSSGGLIGLLASFSSQAEPKSEFERERQAMRVFQKQLSVRRIGLTYVIDVGFRSHDPERAAQIANAVADAYIVDQLEAKYQATRRASVWLQDRIRELREQASAAERAVVEFKTKNNIVGTGGPNGRLVGEQQVAELSSQLVIARAQTGEARARFDRVQSILSIGSPDATVNATVADTLKNEVITKLRSQYLDIASREANWSSRYGANHLAAVNLRNQMREIRNAILDELKRIAEGYKSDYQIAIQREEGVQKELAQAVAESQVTNSAQVTLRELESTSQTYRGLYDNFLKRYMESVQQQSFPITDSRVISPASRPLRKSDPNTLLILAISGLGGAILGFGIALLRDLSDRVFRTTEQVESSLRTNCIALIPLIKIEGSITDTLAPRVNPVLAGIKTIATGLLSQPKKAPDAPPPRTIARRRNLFWSVVDAPFSRYAEGVRAIKIAADLNDAVKSNKVIGFTSSLPNEGKSTLAVALAQVMSQGGHRCILLDCDIRNPSLSRGLTPDASAGILEVIVGKNSLEDVIWTDPSTNMAFLPTVANLRLANSSDILASDPMKLLFEKLRRTYDCIIVDLSPLAPVVDVRATTHLVDSYIFVIEWGRTKIDVVERALSGADVIYENLLGAVLNKANMDTLGRYENYGSNYYQNKHYSRYGYTD